MDERLKLWNSFHDLWLASRHDPKNNYSNFIFTSTRVRQWIRLQASVFW